MLSALSLICSLSGANVADASVTRANVLSATLLNSGKAIYPAQRISARGIERIEIIGVRGALKLHARPAKVYQLKVRHSRSQRFEDWNLLVERRGKTLFLEVASSAYGRQLQDLMRGQTYPEFDIELEGPSRPTLVNWKQGHIEVVGWSAPVETSLIRGDVKVSGGGSHQTLKMVSGSVSVQRYQGDLDLNGERGKVTISDLKGKLKLIWHEGAIQLLNVRGDGDLETYSSPVEIRNSRGTWAAKATGGKFLIANFKGRFKGSGQTTKWLVYGRQKSEIQIVNQSGPVKVDWKSTAHVFLSSKSGEIFAPYLPQDRDGQRVAEGRKGKNPLAEVFVRTETGDITFKY